VKIASRVTSSGVVYLHTSDLTPHKMAASNGLKNKTAAQVRSDFAVIVAGDWQSLGQMLPTGSVA
jgi:hypothetical protein